ncbi:uncharacterized protein Z518_11018 [Rhinocladiella mackenziei CBS 650.93]|uniref:DSBA-like thioredoxin domain-containing protein n=1 Tax=Rhinocladiella mackenziei CBS 650.93 TaxID=1442369 RepID=A0A0D2I8Q1_9EURO|nr:uncharacterized protein Z518_11018 [Rhinocladiella mackenziei CBS 650.93]KIW99605.1 hypothetical protein Z518_11018 [Rhinocladiella mackenziei CBS 650.93]
MTRPKLSLYYDLHSPYAYLAFYAIKNSSTFKSCDVTYIPVLLVAYIKAIGLQPPWSSPNKINWMVTDITRSAREFNIPWTQGWPMNYPAMATTVKVQRVLVACSHECPERYPDVIGALFHAFWVEKKGVQLPEIYEPIITDILGKEISSRIVEQA